MAPAPTPKYPIREGYLYEYIDGRHQRIRPLVWREMYSSFDLLPGEDDWHLEQESLKGDDNYKWLTDLFGPLPTEPEPPSAPMHAIPTSPQPIRRITAPSKEFYEQWLYSDGFVYMRHPRTGQKFTEPDHRFGVLPWEKYIPAVTSATV